MVGTPFSTAETPLDRAVTLWISNDSENALRWAAGIVKAEPRNAGALLVASSLLGELGRRDAALGGLEVCVTRSIDSAHLAMSVLACKGLAQLGADASPRLDAIAETFAKGSKRLAADTSAPPPSLKPPDAGFQPLSAEAGALLDDASCIVSDARSLLERDADSRDSPPCVPEQPLFSSLERDALRAMIEGFDQRMVGSGDVLVEEGTMGSEAFVVARGELEVQRSQGPDKEPIRLARLGADALFGEMALLSRAPRAASVIACRPTIVLVETKETLDAIASKVPAVGVAFAQHCRRRMVDNLVRASAILRSVRSAERRELIERFVSRTFEAGDCIIEQGQEASGLHLIASGEVAVIHREGDDDTVIATLGPGEVVGEVSLVLRRPSNAAVVADHPTVTLHLPRVDFQAIIKDHPKLLAELYDLAVRRDEETTTIVAQEATEADELILL